MPDFGSKEYWENRFNKNSNSYDWLQPAQVLRSIVTSRIPTKDLLQAEVLHIGCGTSDALVLRDIVLNPQQLHNVDYSQAAIAIGSCREKELLRRKSADSGSTRDEEPSTSQSLVERPTMRWSCLDLLTIESTLNILEQQVARGRLYDVVLDKSTSDSIACAQPASLALPYPLSISEWSRSVLQSDLHPVSADVHPLHVLAIHLAAVTVAETGKWIVVSYSEDRFPFFEPLPRTEAQGLLPDNIVQAGFPHPASLWRLESRERIEAPHLEEALAPHEENLSSSVVYRPDTSHWLYILVRTDVRIIY